MDSKLEKKIREYEEAGIDVVVEKNGRLEYFTGGISEIKEVCDRCKHLYFSPDPDPDDWFRDADKRADCYCLTPPRNIARSLELPSEMVNIHKPEWCPLKNKE